MSNKVKKKKSGAIPVFNRPVERYFNQLDQLFRGNKVLYAIFLSLAFYGVMGLVWMIPFPQLAFLERMNAQTFLNWGSFFIAIVVYSYLKLAPTLSYAMLFSICLMSFLIVQVEYLQRDYGISATIVFGIISLIAIAGTWSLTRRENKAISFSDFMKLLAIGPIWLWSKVFERLGWKY